MPNFTHELQQYDFQLISSYKDLDLCVCGGDGGEHDMWIMKVTISPPLPGTNTHKPMGCSKG